MTKKSFLAEVTFNKVSYYNQACVLEKKLLMSKLFHVKKRFS